MDAQNAQFAQINDSSGTFLPNTRNGQNLRSGQTSKNRYNLPQLSDQFLTQQQISDRQNTNAPNTSRYKSNPFQFGGP